MISYPIAVSGITTRVLEALPESDGSMTTVVLVHGVGARADRYRYNLDPLGEVGHRAVAIDLPGHGFADKGRLPYGVPYYANFLRHALMALGIEDCVLVGSSLGGNVVARVAADEPKLARGLVLVGCIGLVPLGAELRNAVSRSITAAHTPEGVEQKLRRVFANPRLVTKNLVREELGFATSPGAAEAIDVLATYFRNHVDDDVVGSDLVGSPDAPPILLVWGAEDRSVPTEVAQQARAQLGSGELVVIPNAGHAPYYEQPDRFNLLLTHFLARIADHS